MSRHDHPLPTPAEQRVLAANDVFYQLLETKPVQAKALSYEIATVAARYAAPQKGVDHGTVKQRHGDRP